MSDAPDGVGFRLPPRPTSPRLCRQLLACLLGDRVDDLDDVLLCLTELVTNAVRHAGTEVHVQLWTTPVLRFEVADETPPTADLHGRFGGGLTMPATSATGGRGLALVAALSTGFAFEPRGTGKVFCVEFAGS